MTSTAVSAAVEVKNQHSQSAEGSAGSISGEQTLAKLHGLEVAHMRLMKQLAANSDTLHLRTLGFEAMTVLVKHLTQEVVT